MFSILQDGWPRLTCVQWYCKKAGLGWLVFSILQEGWPRQACVQYITGRLAQADLRSVYYRMAGPGWLVFSSIVGRLA